MIKRNQKNPHLDDIDVFVKNNSIKFEKIMRGGEAMKVSMMLK